MAKQRELFLKPRKKATNRGKNIATVDLEANRDLNADNTDQAFLNVEMVGFYDGEFYVKFDTVKAFLQFVLRKKYRRFRIYAHFGGKYDFLFILDELQRSFPDFVCHSPLDDNGEKRGYKMVHQGPKAIQITVCRGKNNWHFVDSSALFPNMSLDSLSKAFNVETKKLTGTINFKAGERVDRLNKKHCEYLEADCISIYQVIRAFQNDKNIKKEGLHLTIASQAMGIFRHSLKFHVRVNPPRVSEFVRKGYAGGRVEIFKMLGRGLQYYDVNSLFPTMMRNMLLPVQFERETKRLRDGALGFLDVEVSSPGKYIPILPMKFEGRLIFPNGRFRGVFFSEELKYALSQGYRIEKIYRGFEFHRSASFFSEYVDTFYELKKNAPKGGAAELISKLLLNSLYGKFGQRPERETLKTFDGTDREFKVFHSADLFDKTSLILVKKIEEAPYMLPQIAAAITSYARIHMSQLAYEKNPEACYYTDTDSILTTLRLPTGPELGQLKLEDKTKYFCNCGWAGDMRKCPQCYSEIETKKKIPLENLNCIFVRPKGYELRDGETNEMLERKMKGFPKEFIASLTQDQFENLDFKYEKTILGSMKRSLISNQSYVSKVSVEKSIKGIYTKRRILSGGETEPWEIRDGIICNRI